MQTTIKILNSLPSSLTSLTFATPCVPSLQWPVTLPSKLKILDLRTTNDQITQVYKDDLINETDPPRFVLPSMLRSLYMPKHDPNWSMSHLPPHLSKLTFFSQGGNADSNEIYFSSRAPPSHLPGYTLYHVKG